MRTTTRAMAAAALALLGCSTEESSSIQVVVVEGEPPLGLTLDTIRVTATRLEGSARQGRVTELTPSYEGERLVPVTVTLRPEVDNDPGRVLYRVRTEGVSGAAVIVSVQHRVAFVPGRSVTLPMRLEGTCVEVPCGGDSTCAGGSCVDDFIPECALLGSAPDCEGADARPPNGPTDGAANDLGMDDDAGVGADVGMDSGEDDGGESDLGPPELDAEPPDAGADVGTDDDAGPPEDLGPPDVGPAEDAGPCPSGCGANEECTPTGCVCAMGFQNCDGISGCESVPVTDPAHCGSCGNACAAPTPSCVAGTCAMCRDATDCDDGLACTTDACSAGTCMHTVVAGRCAIDGTCREAGATNGPCQVCDPDSNRTGWTALADGHGCDDGLFCTLNDECMAGECTGSGSPCGTNESYRCVPVCRESSDSCTANFGGAATWCYIDNRCIHEAWDAQHPTNQCLGCEPSIDRFDWSPRQDAGVGEACNDGLFCTAVDRCTLTSSPSCVGSGATCDDGLTCTTDSCNEGSNSCSNVPMSGFCAIGGACYDSLERNPANECQHCATGTSQTAWSARPSGVACGSFGACCGGTCQACSEAACGCGVACLPGEMCVAGAAARCTCF
ncbi:MAG: hypothetical protein IT379_07860 [Deltaproteobacteria bacterium]|nr:hypothetical protein [Deltaproteobacteria bacterium]